MEKPSSLYSHKYINSFNPDVFRLKSFMHRDLLSDFNAGDQNIPFNNYLIKDAEEDMLDGNGMTYLVCNTNINEETLQPEITDLVAYYTLCANSIPYETFTKYEGTEIEELGKHYEFQLEGVSAIEIKMFALDQKYQDIFFNSDDESLPIASWILKSIIDSVNIISKEDIGAKTIYLQSVPAAVQFYKRVGFLEMDANMKPLHTCDSDDLKPMYYPLRKIHTTFDYGNDYRDESEMPISSVSVETLGKMCRFNTAGICGDNENECTASQALCCKLKRLQ